MSVLHLLLPLGSLHLEPDSCLFLVELLTFHCSHMLLSGRRAGRCTASCTGGCRRVADG